MAPKLPPVIPMRCPRCGHTWNLPRRADKTWPQTAACAKHRGGCGHIVKVPKRQRDALGGTRAAPVADAPGDPGPPRCCEHCARNRDRLDVLTVVLALALVALVADMH